MCKEYRFDFKGALFKFYIQRYSTGSPFTSVIYKTKSIEERYLIIIVVKTDIIKRNIDLLQLACRD